MTEKPGKAKMYRFFSASFLVRKEEEKEEEKSRSLSGSFNAFPYPTRKFLKKFLKNFLDFCNLKILRKRHDQVERTDNPVHRQ